jgi:HPt (histidine-containing phosphotransfer) domain-containing protein
VIYLLLLINCCLDKGRSQIEYNGYNSLMDNTDKIQKLRDDYKNSLLDKSVIISDLLLMISTDASDSGASVSDKTLIELHQYLHKLAGSSGMYGYSEIAQLSRAAMQSSKRKATQLLTDQLGELRDLLKQSAVA